MKQRCSCCNSTNIKRQSEKDRHKFDNDAIIENIYECLDCGMTDVFDFEYMIKEVKEE